MNGKKLNKIPVSVVVLTKNEERNIEDCLRSVHGWADELIVVDDESTDRTVEYARKYTDKVFFIKKDVEGIHRNWAYAQAKNTWVLSLDADEQVTEELKMEIESTLSNNTEFVAFSIPLRNYIGNHWVRYGGWYPAGKTRLFRKDKFRLEEVKVHPRAFIEGECGHLTKDIINKGYYDFSRFMVSINRQTTWEAEKWITTNRNMSLTRIIWRAVDRFFRRYVRKKGYKDGLIGFMVAYLDSFYQILSYAKYREMKGGDKK